MIERYIYAVTRELPEKSRKETAEELRVLINYRLDKADKTLSEEERIDKVLRELGNPRKMADRFRGRERYLIGPKYFYKYLFVLKIVVLSIIIGISVVSGLAVLFSTESFVEVISGYLVTLFSAVLQGVVWVTGIFVLLEYNDVSVEPGKEQEEWDPSKLPSLPKGKDRISRVESVFSIVFTTLFLLLFFFLRDRIGIYYRSGGEYGFIPLLDVEAVSLFEFLIFFIFILNITVELIKLIKGRWTITVAGLTSILNIISAAISIYIIYYMDIWHSQFIERFEEFMPLSFERSLVFTIVIIIIVTLIEALASLYKGIKYSS
ncbi:hypothetical protein SAMN04488102_10483 [Alkalibacterium subtropicum]|uniref:Uncharacterized protein n=1 Tax=Alkalibacterium subtropicum TaxID=753702 RepID=A0A1I1HIG2_9LACT|nr:hypothetical protein [Alkalibacterium subtropicum]SFC23764.1 hypothetical protein SAMN04488102_10483 [Alkalibacterium subtropicum]